MGLFNFGKKPKAKAPLVYANPNSKVYHYEFGGCGVIASDAKGLPEAQAIANGMSRCKKCDWHNFDWSNGNG